MRQRVICWDATNENVEVRQFNALLVCVVMRGHMIFSAGFEQRRVSRIVFFSEGLLSPQYCHFIINCLKYGYSM